MDIVTISGRNYDSNIYLINGKHPTIIDTGTGIFSKDIIKKIEEYFPVDSLDYIILTHEHFDHVGGTVDIQKASKKSPTVIAHTNAVEKLHQAKSSFAQMLGCTMPSITVDKPVSDNDEILCGDQLFTVLYTPGHSQGSICLYHKQDKILISGDTIFAHGDFGRYDLPGGNFQTLLDSIKRLSKLEINHLYPGHGPFIEQDAQKHVLQSYHSIQSMSNTATFI